MLDGLLRIRESLNIEIPEQIWVLITQMTNALKPFFDLNTKMQAIHFTVGDLIRDICACVGVLKTLSDPVALSLLKAIRQRQKLISENLNIAAAIYMDPRLTNKLRSYLTPEAKIAVINFLVATHDRIQISKRRTEHEKQPPLTDKMRREVAPGSGTQYVLTTRAWFETCEFPSEVAPLQKTETVPEKLSIKSRLEALQKVPMPIADIDALRHWGFMVTSDPEMAELAAVVLSVPASRVSLERAFNALPQIMTTFGSSMNTDTENLENVLFVKLNMENIQ